MKTKELTLPFISEQLVSIQNGKVMTSSLQVANYFGKEHKHVLRDIRNMDCSAQFQESNFGLSFYIRDLEGRGQHKYPMYYMTKDGFSFLVMGFTGKQAAKFKEDYINAFNRMEEYIRGRSVNEKEIFDYLSGRIKKIAANTREVQEKCARETGLPVQIISDIANGCFWNDKGDLKGNLSNLLSIFNNNTAAGWYATYRYLKADRDSKTMRQKLQEISDSIYHDFKIFPL